GSNNAITITTGESKYQNSLIEITDSAGKQVCKDKINSGYYKTENLSKGVYIVKIYIDKEVITKKVIVN
ncbi:MAG: T9SS type A sorting domain-containing protein, partial [Bacteroidetes bacterium]|nr:T9SS type A sorting domain-containing protein [Bacteroidota bacterium]